MAAPAGRIRYWIGKAWLTAFGWRIDGAKEAPPAKFVLLAAPHTSGWDLPFMLACSYVMRTPISWMGKQELFAPFGWFMRALGGVPIDRGARHDRVRWAADLFAGRERIVLAVPAEGTRGKVPYWKSGFYHIAKGASVPIGLGYVDYGRKTTGIGGYVWATEDVRADMDRVRAFYAGISAKHPEKKGVPRLREEDGEERATDMPSLEPRPV